MASAASAANTRKTIHIEPSNALSRAHRGALDANGASQDAEERFWPRKDETLPPRTGEFAAHRQRLKQTARSTQFRHDNRNRAALHRGDPAYYVIFGGPNAGLYGRFNSHHGVERLVKRAAGGAKWQGYGVREQANEDMGRDVQARRDFDYLELTQRAHAADEAAATLRTGPLAGALLARTGRAARARAGREAMAAGTEAVGDGGGWAPLAPHAEAGRERRMLREKFGELGMRVAAGKRGALSQWARRPRGRWVARVGHDGCEVLGMPPAEAAVPAAARRWQTHAYEHAEPGAGVVSERRQAERARGEREAERALQRRPEGKRWVDRARAEAGGGYRERAAAAAAADAAAVATAAACAATAACGLAARLAWLPALRAALRRLLPSVPRAELQRAARAILSDLKMWERGQHDIELYLSSDPRAPALLASAAKRVLRQGGATAGGGGGGAAAAQAEAVAAAALSCPARCPASLRGEPCAHTHALSAFGPSAPLPIPTFAPDHAHEKAAADDEGPLVPSEAATLFQARHRVHRKGRRAAAPCPHGFDRNEGAASSRAARHLHYGRYGGEAWGDSLHACGVCAEQQRQFAKIAR